MSGPISRMRTRVALRRRLLRLLWRTAADRSRLRALIDYLSLREFVRIELPGIPTTVRVRRSSDQIRTLGHIFESEDYQIPVDLEFEWIVDAGAHIGLSSLYFHRCFPAARLLAIEPDPENFQLLSENLGSLPNVSIIEGAVWDTAETVQISNPTADSWSYRMEAGTSGVRGYLLAELIAEVDTGGPGLVKLDIEGAERRVLESSKSWIDRPSLMVLELHDRFEPGCTEALHRAIAGREHKIFVRGENTFVRFTPSS